MAETDKIFENVHKINKESDKNKQTLRVSIGTKAKISIGEFSRNGKCRTNKEIKALDHDMQSQAKLIPFGILDVVTGLVTFIFGTSVETSDFYVDCLILWWKGNKQRYEHITELVINLDNGPDLASNRTQFIKRMVEFTDHIECRVRLIYYPPYHSKYNPIERVWGILEVHWNGTLLDSVEKTLKWAASMIWKGLTPTVYLLSKTYQKGVSLVGQEKKRYELYLDRSSNLPKWDVVIEPI
ncbi:transposase [Candidatus Uabimicrobium helgolandensis]